MHHMFSWAIDDGPIDHNHNAELSVDMDNCS